LGRNYCCPIDWAFLGGIRPSEFWVPGVSLGGWRSPFFGVGKDFGGVAVTVWSYFYFELNSLGFVER
jgi:hypothetical protein